MATRGIRDLLNIELPIIQAPLAGVQVSALAIAASSAGALGSLPCAMLSLDAIRSELAAMRAASSAPCNVNFFCHTPPVADVQREEAWQRALAPYYAEFGIDAGTVRPGPGRAAFNHDAADVIEAFRPEVVSFHFGLPDARLVERVKSWGAMVLSSATTVDEARWLEARGVDAVIAQGLEAGGHRGHFLSDDLSLQVGTFTLLPQVIATVDVPVIAAGGIVDAKRVAAAMAFGAAAVQVGTAYMLCPEATTSPVHRAVLKGDAARHTALTNLFTGRPARGVVNRLMRELGPISSLPPEFPLATAAILPLRSAAESRGSGDFSPLWSGQNASGCRNVPAAQLTRDLAAVID